MKGFSISTILVVLPSSALCFQQPQLINVASTKRPFISSRTPLARQKRPLAAANLETLDSLTSAGLTVAASAADYQFQGSYASLYVTLGLFVLSFPGIISLVTRSVKVKMDQKTYVVPGPEAKEDAKPVRQTAAEIMAYFQQNNYKVADAGETIVFKGIVERSKSQAAFLTTCLFGGLWCLALVLSIQLPKIGPIEIGDWYYLMCLASPYAGYFYWTNAQSDDEARVRIITADNEATTEVVVQASKEELERFASVMDFNEKGKIRIRGIFETAPAE